MRPLAAVILLLTVLGATRGEGARPSTSTCRELCADEILACMQSGRRPQACRRHLVRRCRRTRGELCGDTVQTWVTSGPIRWEVEAPATVAPDQHFALVLDVGAATTRVEGRVRACHGVSADGACDPSVDPFVHDPPSFAGLPGRIAIDTHVDQAFDGPLDWSLHAELYLYDQDGVRHGPFVSPLMHTTIDLTNELRIRAAEQNTGKGSVTLAALAGTQASTEIFFWIGGNSVAGGGSFVVTATSDAAWLHAAPADPVSFHVAADSTGLEPRPIPYTGHLTFAAPGIPAPSVVDVALYVLPMIDVQWVTPPPAVIAGGPGKGSAITAAVECARSPS